MHHGELDRTHLQNLGAERGKLQHLLVGNAVETPRALHDPGIGGVDAIDIGIDVAALGGDGGRDRNRGGI